MTSFGWKRKIGDKISKGATKTFTKDVPSDDEDEAIKSGEVDWISLGPKPKVLVLESVTLKAQRLASEGATLAEAERYWEALRKWDQALQLTPEDSKIYEMKAQAYMNLNEVFPALQAASKAVELSSSLWWPAYQTLGRAHLGLGEVRLAVKSFCRALHLNPAEQEVWEEDLAWACDLLAKKKRIQKELTETTKKSDKPTGVKVQDLEEVPTYCTDLEPVSSHRDKDEDDDGGESEGVNSIPGNYVVMRD